MGMVQLHQRKQSHLQPSWNTCQLLLRMNDGALTTSVILMRVNLSRKQLNGDAIAVSDGSFKDGFGTAA